MSYFSPYINETGFHMPTYSDIRDKLIDDAKSIFGQDIYLGDDSQDYQWIATVSEKIYDAFQIAQQVYNNRAPNEAVGRGLDSIVKINGIKRKAATYSECIVTISGVSGTTIKNGVVLDNGNIKWDLPATVTIPNEGQIDVLAVCEIPGPIVANSGDITGIYNPTYGWNGVYNKENSTIGSQLEDDSKLRQRQSQSTANASNTMLEGTSGAVAQVKGVIRKQVYENDTNEVDERGLPPHSITVIAEGGENEEIAKAIWKHKGIGCYTNGDVVVNILDSKDQITPIRFFRPIYNDIFVVINIKTLNGYTTATTESIKKKLETYLNSLEIGVELTVSALWGVALQAMESLANPTFSITAITAGKSLENQSTEDIKMNYKEVCRGSIDNITINIS